MADQYLQYDFRFSQAVAPEPSFPSHDEFRGTATIDGFAFSMLTEVPFSSGSLLSPDFTMRGYRVNDQGNQVPFTELLFHIDSGIATLVPSGVPLPPFVAPGDGCFVFPVVGPSPAGPGTGGYDDNCNLPGHGNYMALVRALFPSLPNSEGTYFGQATYVSEVLTSWGERGPFVEGEVSLTIIQQVPEPASLLLLLPIAALVGSRCRHKLRHE